MDGMRAGLVGAMLAAALAAEAGRAQDAGSDPLAACASIAGRAARLACYDNAARRHVPPPAPREPAAARARARAPIAQGLGSEQVRDRRPKAERPLEVTRTTARVVSATDNGIGHWRIALDSGAVWQMTLADPYFQPPKPGQDVRIRRGAVGGYLMDVGRQSAVSVARIR